MCANVYAVKRAVILCHHVMLALRNGTFYSAVFLHAVHSYHLFFIPLRTHPEKHIYSGAFGPDNIIDAKGDLIHENTQKANAVISAHRQNMRFCALIYYN